VGPGRLLIEEGNTLYPVEIKSGSTVAPNMLAGFQRWMNLAGPASRYRAAGLRCDGAYARQGVLLSLWFAV
jgi:hypothetical protein